MWCTLGSTRTITWISECGGLMTLLQPSRPLCYQGSSAPSPHWGACISQDQRRPVGLRQSSCWARCTRPLTHWQAHEDRRKQTIRAEGINLDATIPAFTPGDAAAVIISDDDETSFPAGWPEAISTPKIELAWGQK